MAGDSVRILIVDDSALYRQLLQNVLREVPGVEVAGTCKDGADLLARIDDLAPDLLTLDVHMPRMSGIEVLKALKSRHSPSRAIMVSGFTAEGAQVTTDCLMEGAFDFILKPAGPDAIANRQALLAALTEKIRVFRESQGGRPGRRAIIGGRRATLRGSLTPRSAFESVVIGTSTGGPVALRELLADLPAEFPVPILIVQHMPAQFTQSLARRLNEVSPLEVVEARDGMTLEAGWAFVAPGGKQMKVVRRGLRPKIQLTDDPPEHGCRPAVDYLFRSAAEVFGGKVVAVVMTGMGRDGTEGCRDLKERGAHVIAQHPEGCVVYGMPKAVIDEQLAHRILPLPEIAAGILEQIGAR